MKIQVTETIANNDNFVLEKILIGNDYPAWFVGSKNTSSDYHLSGYFFATRHCSHEYFELSVNSAKSELTSLEETLFIGNQGRSFSEMKSYIFS